jgi:dihydrofolate synthase / folylpolyglutamate synthase
MTYPQTLEYLFSRLPMYQRVGAAAYKADLSNTVKLMEALGKPHTKLKCIHVAGTNGKGSCSHMIAAVLQQAGYKTGLYTSPHLSDFRERIKINGKLITKNYVTEFVEKNKPLFEKVEPSFFEWTVALAFQYFLDEEVDVAVIEVGLGGRLDSTNVITPVASLITNISYDHMNLLGDTLEKIAKEKAGIIKLKVPVTISQYQSETQMVFNAMAKEMRAPIVFADKYYRIISAHINKGIQTITVLNRVSYVSKIYELDLLGSYQQKNLMGVLHLLEILKQNGFLIEDENISNGLKQVCALTGLSGRWQLLNEKPLTIADTGHNEDGILNVLESLKRHSYKQLHFVFGTVNDKDITKILQLLPKEATYYFVKASVPRALDEQELTKQASLVKLKGKAYKNVLEGIKAAKKAAKKEDIILIGGSTFVVADALEDKE